MPHRRRIICAIRFEQCLPSFGGRDCEKKMLSGTIRPQCLARMGLDLFNMHMLHIVKRLECRLFVFECLDYRINFTRQWIRTRFVYIAVIEEGIYNNVLRIGRNNETNNSNSMDTIDVKGERIYQTYSCR